MRLDIGLLETERAVAAREAAGWEQKRELVLASCHPRQRDFATDPHRRVAGLVGRGGGKTTGGRARFVLRMLSTPKARCLYIATNREQAEKLMWAPLKDLFEILGFRSGVDVIYNESKLRVTLKRNGATLWLFGADDKRDIDKLRGMPFHEVGIDEAASYPVELLKQLINRIIGPRLGDYGGCIWLIGTPGHVLQGIFYDATRPGSSMHRPYADRDAEEYANWPGWSSHAWTLSDGAKTVPAMKRLWAEALVEKRAQGWSDDNPVWLREYLGQWAADDTENVFKYRPHLPDGTPWNQWDPERVGPLKTAKLPDDFSDWSFVYGMDLGHADPFSLQVLAFSPSDPSRTIYHVYEFEKRQMHPQSIAHLLIGEALVHEDPDGIIGETGWPDGMVADLAGNGDSIVLELQKVYGITVKPSEKKAKFSAIEVVNGDLVDGRLKILKGSKLEAEMLQLQWVVNEFGQLKENKTQSNHATDACIYARRALSGLISAGAIAPKTIEGPNLIETAEEDAPEQSDYTGLLAGDYEEMWGNG